LAKGTNVSRQSAVARVRRRIARRYFPQQAWPKGLLIDGPRREGTEKLAFERYLRHLLWPVSVDLAKLRWRIARELKQEPGT